MLLIEYPKKQRLFIILLIALGLILQIITAINAIGYFHPDQHFQIVEFSSTLTAEDEPYEQVWEYENKIRPSLAVYLYYGLRKASDAIGIHNAFSEQLIARLFMAVILFLLSIKLVLKQLEKHDFFSQALAISLLCFSWALPYTRTMFSSENLGAIFLILPIISLTSSPKKGIQYFIIGLFLGVSFYLRFQMAFAVLGVVIYLLLQKTPFQRLFFLSLGGLIAIILNTWLDSSFYGEFVITPWRYFEVNIMDGVAASFGVRGPLYYPFVILLLMSAPILSIVFFVLMLFGIYKKPKSLITLVFLAFLVGHTLVGHKEERFLVPIFSLLPILTVYGYEYIKDWISKRKFLKYLLLLIAIPSIIFNLAALALFSFVPYHQNLAFAERLEKEYRNEKQIVYCLGRHPFQTPSYLQTKYYHNTYPENIQLITIEDISELPKNESVLLASKYKFIRDNPFFENNDDLSIVFYSIKQLYGLAIWIEARSSMRIDDAWVLYTLNKTN